ncbi:tetratricopeptide repeat protein [Maricaulaceae bacterium MS644]
MTLTARHLFAAAAPAAAIAALCTAAPASAQAPLEPDQRHRACIQAIAVDAEAAYEEALAWRHQAGGWPSEHCVSLALIALGQAEDGADRLRAAAEGAISATNRSRAIMFGQAGDAYLEAGLSEKALSAFSRGIDFDETDSGLRRGRAEAALARENYEAAEDYAGEAIAVDASDAEAHRLRGEARLAAGDLNGAEADMRNARTLAPENIDVLLLRGRINEARRLGTIVTLD